jgi:hypothetical protein
MEASAVERALAAALVSLSLLVPSAAAQTAPAGDTAAELRRLTQALLDAIGPGDLAPWQRTLDERFVHLDENGVVRDRPAFLKELTPLPPGLVGRIEIDRFDATVRGDTVVTVYEIQEFLDYHGQQLRSRFRSLDTWTSTPDGWRLLAEHTAAVLKDPPAARLTREELCACAGTYSLTDTIAATIRCADDGLISERADRPPAKYTAELRDVFFVSGQPRTRRIFTRDTAGRIDGFVDRREGEDVRWTRRAEAAPRP